MRNVFIVTLGLAVLTASVAVQPARADCRSEKAACIKGASSPFDSVACGSLFRTCAANHAIAAQQQAAQNPNKPATQNPSPPTTGGTRPVRR